jgi:U3 small nucleolar RNA-associated protein 21
MSAITGMVYNRASDLVALTCDDISIRVVDVETKKLVRELWGCQGKINDIVSFSMSHRNSFLMLLVFFK